jgi:hypothetical protein
LYEHTLAKMPSDQRATLVEFSKRLHAVMTKESDSRKVNVPALFMEAVCGKMARPAASDELESYPASTVLGLAQGDDGPLLAFLNRFPPVLQFLQRELLSGTGRDSPQPTIAFEVLSAANMLWCTRFPSDYEAYAKDASRPLHHYDPAAAARNSGRRDELGKKMKQLLVLNLRLHYPPNVWVPLLEFRDASIDGMNKVLVLPGTPPQVTTIVENYGSSVNGLPIGAKPRAIAEYLETRLSKVRLDAEAVTTKGSAYVCRQLANYVNEQLEHLRHVVAECLPPLSPPSPPHIDGEAVEPN